MILECIVWPWSITHIFDRYKDEDQDEDELSREDVCRVSNYLRRFIENGLFKDRSCWSLFVFLLLTTFLFCFGSRNSSRAQKPRKVLGRLGTAHRGDEDGNSGRCFPFSSDLLREAEAAQALHNVPHVSPRAVCLHSNH